MENQLVLSADRIGSLLRVARLNAGMTVADVAALTKVSTPYLVAIEREEFDRLPSRVHILGFARAFAKAVNVDEGLVLNVLRTKLNNEHQSQNSAGLPGTKSRPKQTIIGAAVRKVVSILPGQLNLMFREAAR